MTLLHTRPSYTATIAKPKTIIHCYCEPTKNSHHTKVVPSLRFVKTLHTAQSTVVTLAHTPPSYSEWRRNFAHHTKVIPSLRFVTPPHTFQSILVTVPHTRTIMHCDCEAPHKSRPEPSVCEYTTYRTVKSCDTTTYSSHPSYTAIARNQKLAPHKSRPGRRNRRQKGRKAETSADGNGRTSR